MLILTNAAARRDRSGKHGWLHRRLSDGRSHIGGVRPGAGGEDNRIIAATPRDQAGRFSRRQRWLEKI